MDTPTATAEVFAMAFQSLSKIEKRAFFSKLLEDKEIYQDLIDIALIEQRRNEPSCSLNDYLAKRAKSS